MYSCGYFLSPSSDLWALSQSEFPQIVKHIPNSDNNSKMFNILHRESSYYTLSTWNQMDLQTAIAQNVIM